MNGPDIAPWRVLVTRPADQAGELAAALRTAGMEPVLYPTIEVVPPASWAELDEALARLSSYELLVFTSPTAVRMTVARAGGAAPLAGPRIAAVGRATARAIEAAGLTVDVVPDADERQEGLVAALGASVRGRRVLFPQAAGGRELLRQELERLGAEVHVVPAYETRPAVPDQPPPPFDAAVFASPSALRAFVASQGAGPLAARQVVAIGRTTAAGARELGVRVDRIATAPDVAALVAAVVACRRDVP
jgi:uroporphyrinogen-III synthase